MYQPGDLTQSITIIHRMMVEQELRRNNPELHPPFRRADRSERLAAVRRVVARGLIALGTRLDPTAGSPAPVASGLRA
jgi:hypothetical protein